MCEISHKYFCAQKVGYGQPSLNNRGFSLSPQLIYCILHHAPFPHLALEAAIVAYLLFRLNVMFSSLWKQKLPSFEFGRSASAFGEKKRKKKEAERFATQHFAPMKNLIKKIALAIPVSHVLWFLVNKCSCDTKVNYNRGKVFRSEGKPKAACSLHSLKHP